MTNFRDVGDFHHKFDLDHTSCSHAASNVGPRDVTRDLVDFRVRFLHEELTELMTAIDQRDTPGIADALVDLVYVALGTAHLFGFPWEELWDEVQRANMAKERATSAAASKRSSAFDVINPEGWTPPDIAGVLRAHGWRT